MLREPKQFGNKEEMAQQCFLETQHFKSVEKKEGLFKKRYWDIRLAILEKQINLDPPTSFLKSK